MHIVFSVEGNVKVEDGRHILDVESARRHIGAHQQINLTAFESFEGFQALILALVAMQCRGFQAFMLKRAGQAGAAEFAVDKHKGLLHAA